MLMVLHGLAIGSGCHVNKQMGFGIQSLRFIMFATLLVIKEQEVQEHST